MGSESSCLFTPLSHYTLCWFHTWSAYIPGTKSQQPSSENGIICKVAIHLKQTFWILLRSVLLFPLCSLVSDMYPLSNSESTLPVRLFPVLK